MTTQFSYRSPVSHEKTQGRPDGNWPAIVNVRIKTELDAEKELGGDQLEFCNANLWWLAGLDYN
jgi:hypothetical protein